MKQYTYILVCIFLIFAIVGCSSNNDTITLASGNYYIVGDYEEHMTPYLWIDAEEHTFSLGAGSIISYAERGSFEINEGKLVATSQSTTFVFEIKDNKTLILIDSGDDEYFKLPSNSEFVYSEELR